MITVEAHEESAHFREPGPDADPAEASLALLAPAHRWLAGAVEPIVAWSLRLSWWGQVVSVWLVSRLFAGCLALLVGKYVQSGQGPLNYLQVADTWDAVFYHDIYDHGYPTVLPLDGAGHVVGSSWAFMPVYPGVVRAVSALSGLEWTLAAPLVSTLASLGFLLAAYQLFRNRQDHRRSIFAVAIIAFWTAAPVLQFNYAESLSLLLLTVALQFIVRGKYLRAIPFVLLTGLTRPLGAPLGLACVLISLMVVGGHHLRNTRLPANRAWSLAALVVAAVAGAFLWTAIAAAATGVPDAYLLTEAAWHGQISRLSINAFIGSFLFFFSPLPGAVMAVGVLIVVASAMLSRRARELGAVMWVWSGSVLGYLVFVLAIETGWPRQVLPAFPLALALASVSGQRAYRWLLLGLLAGSQVIWMMWLWRFGTWDPSSP